MVKRVSRCISNCHRLVGTPTGAASVWLKEEADAFQIVTGWWGHQPGQRGVKTTPAVGGVLTAHEQHSTATV